jgi:dynein heavy chain 1
VITAAQGELALEEFLSGSREYWETLPIDLTSYQDKCHLINNWNALFSKLNEDLSSISHMKQSPFFQVMTWHLLELTRQAFAEDTAIWESKLTMLYCLLELWSNVQRRWVYLEGIFSGEKRGSTE